MVLHNISWQTYEALLADHRDASSPRFTYDRGVLEIMSPLRRHEQLNRTIATLIEVVAEGTETEAQVEYLARLGCGFAQGFYFSRAMEPAQIDLREANLSIS